MSNYTDFNLEEIFGKDNVIYIKNREKKEEFIMSEDVREFLDRVGLPRQYEELSLRFSLDFSAIENLNKRYDQLKVFGCEFDVSAARLVNDLESDDFLYSYICYSKDDRSVYSVSVDSFKNVRFVNSSIPYLGKCLIAYRESQMKIESSLDDDDFIYRTIEALEAKFLKIDPEVFSSDENWWSCVFTNIYG